MQEIFNRIFRDNKSIYTLSENNKRVYGEKIIRKKNSYLREWDPRRSKLAAAILKGFKHANFDKKLNILYLGASTGTTVSHLSDICISGRLYAVELSYDSFVKLYSLSQARNNIFPILEDANLVERYKFFVEKCDFIYQDIAQRNQVQIFNQNADIFKPRSAILIIKIKAISSKEPEKKILKETISSIRKYNIKEIIDLRPYDIGNYLVYMER
ncbi:fibrillarin-like rRNA/tRNA 2'-O-methyltransferase [Picrophilus oshimae]|uniref:Fibrillarin-like rRNA/tRNA 2'-O-methyltransferase n=1 Tax=Picrophilus torridus (strain ATCC 700027 / DSM 9790 / JCM 10055 / NBRC 100828 / KAW 2/3) TaxID=1122961 RepID=FLPA_PICTO|nr:fibrillarin-like rRNA/tRNA 2'-O-methyltransferase [Picrophilus oshimae]Q6KZQ5.1 RecName: Full=Fibrillarin-like rRNA/tRNA 2'-O-methyltransferase [Picrophilus oshimae DSM 9789]AAT43797.1 fibrillarin-like pre-rRNA processing protein [Picrophilus oshimae DSM 9789]